MAMEFRWEFRDAAADLARLPAVIAAGQRFPSQSDAESWLGELWPDLAAAGAVSAALFEGDRRVYGPMSLRA